MSVDILLQYCNGPSKYLSLPYTSSLNDMFTIINDNFPYINFADDKYKIFINNKLLTLSDDYILNNFSSLYLFDNINTISIYPCLIGGKGGFGANLKADAHRRRNNLPPDTSRMRLLNGQRVGDVEALRQLQQYTHDIQHGRVNNNNNNTHNNTNNRGSKNHVSATIVSTASSLSRDSSIITSSQQLNSITTLRQIGINTDNDRDGQDTLDEIANIKQSLCDALYNGLSKEYHVNNDGTMILSPNNPPNPSPAATTTTAMPTTATTATNAKTPTKAPTEAPTIPPSDNTLSQISPSTSNTTQNHAKPTTKPSVVPSKPKEMSLNDLGLAFDDDDDDDKDDEENE